MAPAKSSSNEEKRKKLAMLRQRHEALLTERATWLEEWRLIAEQMRPRGFREQSSETNKADRAKQRAIINFTPIEARRTLASGMMTGITSPSRPWFRLTLGDPELAENPDVKSWLTSVTRNLLQLAARSNLYGGLHMMYDDFATFGIVAMHIEPDKEDGARAYVFPVGSFCLASGPRGNVDTIFRDVALTVGQLVKLFGEERCSTTVRTMYTSGALDTRVDVVHAIYPNDAHEPGVFGAKGKAFCSDWWEKGSADAAPEVFLRESGYSRFPVLCPRWSRNGEDVYGTGPGHDALGDCRALQLLERRAAQAVDKIVTPPMSAPVAARGSPVSLLPGEINFVDGLGAGQALRPAVEVQPMTLQVFEVRIQRLEDRIKRAFFAHLWLLISEQSGQMTATEVDQRREEKMQQLGAVLEGLNDEALDPLLDILFDIADAQGLVPEPPEELAGRDLKPEYISIMAAAQKLLAVTGLGRFAAFVMQLAAGRPDALDKVDWDNLIDEYADALGVPPATIKTKEAVAALREARQKMQAQAAQMQAMQAGATTAKTLADTQLESPSALTTMMRGMGVQ